MTDNLDGAQYLQMIRGGVAVLNARRQQINDLNVFPIPDGDTGDNMYMTLEAGLSASGESLSDVASSAAKGMLMGARGNSGVILSRIFAGIAKGLEGCRTADAGTFGRAMEQGVKESYGAKVVVKGHGSSKAVAVEKCIGQACRMEAGHLSERIGEAVAKYEHFEE